MRIALEGRRRGKPVVAVEERARAESIETARRHGVFVVEGNAAFEPLLRRVHADRAEVVIATCHEDHTNVEIAVAVGRLLGSTSTRDRPMLCRLLIEDPELRDMLVKESQFAFGKRANGGSSSGYRVNFNDLDFHDTAARQVLAAHPLDFSPIRRNDRTQVHLVVVGYSAMGRALALHAAQIAHFANRVDHGIKTCITIVDSKADELVADFKQRQEELDKICELHAMHADPTKADFVEKLSALGVDGQGHKQLVTYAICFENHDVADGAINFRIGAGLARQLGDRKAQTLIYAGTHRGFAALLSSGNEGSVLNQRLYPFGMVEDVFTLDALLHESDDRVARALHEDYQQKQRQKGVSDEENPGWEQLPESLIASNRHAADHIPIKVRALGYHVARLQPGLAPIESFDKDEVDLLARMEHFRWCAERWLLGWKKGPKDIALKTNPNLVSWEELTDPEQCKDPEQVRTIVRALKQNGQGIYR